MSGGEGMGMAGGSGFGRGMRGLGEGRRGGHSFQPPMKMMRTDDSGLFLVILTDCVWMLLCRG